MQLSPETTRVNLVQRSVAFGMALATTAFVATSTAVVFTGSGMSVGATLARAAITPIRAVIGF